MADSDGRDLYEPRIPPCATHTGPSAAPDLCAFIQYTAEYGGSPISGLSIVELLLRSRIRVAAIFGITGPLEERYREAGCEVHRLRHGQWLAGGGRIRRLRRLSREARATWRFWILFRRLKPRIVYVNTLVSVSAVVAARALGIPVIWHIRELFEDAGGEMHLPLGGRRVVQFVVQRAPTKVVFISHAVRKNIIGGASVPHASVIYNPLSADFFERQLTPRQARQLLDLPEDAFVIGVPGTLRPVKGHQFLLDAAADVLRRHSDCHFAISGPVRDEYARGLQRRCTELGIAQNVHFLGEVKDMPTFYSACDVICVPSRGEPFGRTVIEAFAQQRPVLATRTGGIVESITDGVTGLLVDYGDVHALATGILRLKGDPNLRMTLAENGRLHALEQCHQSVFDRQLARLFVSLSRVLKASERT